MRFTQAKAARKSAASSAVTPDPTISPRLDFCMRRRKSRFLSSARKVSTIERKPVLYAADAPNCQNAQSQREHHTFCREYTRRTFSAAARARRIASSAAP